ncbi:MAG: pyruvoyl-dependent arginine decarboxylase [Burkholderiales bacterium]|nr:pyruvoyl-dependent arginine decarboxylase [Burkholderiales bacterium]
MDLCLSDSVTRPDRPAPAARSGPVETAPPFADGAHAASWGDGALAAPFGAIALATGLGEGPTPLAAFDAALLDAGVANYNLICLSSVIPPGSVIERRRWHTPRADWGRRLYCVLSQMREGRPGHAAQAGIGWVRDEATGSGLFVELHHEDRAQLDADLRATLRSMQAQRGVHFGAIHTEIASATCRAQPVCALVIAVYAAAPW